MDEFEEAYPELTNQRFHGFKRLSMANSDRDPSYLCDKITGDIFRKANVRTPHRAFYQVFIDTGQGPTYFGLYIMAEVPARPMFLSQFGKTGGNLYKGDLYANWVEFDKGSFEKKTNKEEADWSDVKNCLDALHASREDPAPWRAGLNRVLDTDGFLRWLAINTVIQDWDTYGIYAHNYYLYADPTQDGRFVWIPWDHNEALKDIMQPLALDLSDASDEWPLIRFLMDDSFYSGIYWSHVEDFFKNHFNIEDLYETLQSTHDLIEPYVIGNQGEQEDYTALPTPEAFYAELLNIKDHIAIRHKLVKEALAKRN